MDYKSQLDRHKQVFSCFTDLPKRMLNMQNHVNLAEFVLHTICSPGCLNLSKAAYFIDNPDFDKFIGVAGFDKKSHDANLHNFNTHWENPEQFSKSMCSCSFNKQVRQIDRPSPKKATLNGSHLKEIANFLEFESPSTFIWDSKHDNNGILIFETNLNNNHLDPEALNMICLLGFCPVF